MINTALWYKHKLGFSIVPQKNKSPIVPWSEFQNRIASDEEIKEWWTINPDAGISAVVGSISNVVVVDCDSQEAIDIIESDLPDSIEVPCVQTPRGGRHYYFASTEKMQKKVGFRTNTDFQAEGSTIVLPPSRGANGKCYEWIVKPASIVSFPLINNIYNIYTHVGHIKTSQQRSTLSTNVYTEFTYGTRDEGLFHVAFCMAIGKAKEQEVYQVLERMIISWGEVPDRKWIESKIESAFKRARSKERNLMQEVREDILSTNGVWMSSEMAKRLHLSTRDELKNLSTCLKRAINEGLIVKHGNKNGCWRTIEGDEELIDYENVDLTPYDIKLPLDVHEYVTIHKGNIIVIAGESNAGKTAFLLNVAIKNAKDFKVNYMSSEMQNGAELRIRMDEFNKPLSSWKPIKFQFRTDNFPDKIEPDGLNIIDYLDEGSDEEAHRMPARLRAIADKLKTGIALVSIQKDPNKDFGYGGSGTLNRSRLYMNITTDNILTIKKGKIWKNKMVNPNGMHCRFTLAAGCRFQRVGEWMHP